MVADLTVRIRSLAQGLEGEISSKLIELADLSDRQFQELGSFDSESQGRLISLSDDVMRWAVEACRPVQPVYGCTFSDVVENDPPVLSPSRPATPEEAVAGLGPEGLEMVKVVRFDDGAAFAWIDANQIAVHAVEVTEVDGAWAISAVRTC